jgi:hypothetical protein
MVQVTNPVTGVSHSPVHYPGARYDTKLWMRDLKEGAAYLPK